MKIMICLNDTKESASALHQAIAWARALAAETLLVTSFVTEDRFHQADIDAARRELDRAKAVMEEAALPCQTHLSIRGLEPGEDLAMWAKEHQVEAIFVGIRRRSKVGKLLLGSIAQYLILNAACPVVTVRG